MKRYLLRFVVVAFAACAIASAFAPADAQTVSNGVTDEWHTQPIISFSLTPNYNAGYGAVLATFGTQPAPTHGPGATGVGTGTVDFGSTLSGDTYLYRYAAHLHITSNDANGFYIYGEAAEYVTNNTSGMTYNPSQTMFYLPSGATSDTNTGFSPGFPFALTSSLVTGGADSLSSPPTIQYTTYPNPIAVSSTGNGDFYYDYQFKVPTPTTPDPGNYYVWIVYTVIGK